jgi:predicted site-specific integrase-resolvase
VHAWTALHALERFDSSNIPSHKDFLACYYRSLLSVIVRRLEVENRALSISPREVHYMQALSASSGSFIDLVKHVTVDASDLVMEYIIFMLSLSQRLYPVADQFVQNGN